MAAFEQGLVIEFLAAPASHGPGMERVERIDTHGAVVFLAGERAYKLKRAVRYPYMDFSTLALRRAACEAELRLNRRTAPALYERVAAITRNERGLSFDGAGEAVDYVVVMRRFDQAMLFDRLAAAGRLTEYLMIELADAIAAFHRAAATRRDFGGAEAMGWVLDINRTGCLAGVPLLDGQACEALDAASRAALTASAALLDRRAADGRLRECHGDLHLRNICLFEGRPTLFDAVEFNERISVIDTLYDFAFLIMDLEHRGLRSFANATFNRYLDASADYGGLAAWPLMLASRAGVRAHTGAAAARAQVDTVKQAGATAEANEYLALARRFLAPPPARLVAIGGLSGTGKSALAHALAPSFGGAPGAAVLRSDVVRKRLAGVQPTERLPDSAYRREMSKAVYDRLLELAATVVGGGHSAIVDAVFLDHGERSAIEDVARRAGVPFSGMWLELPLEERARRVGTRSRDASDATVEVARRQEELDPGPMAWSRVSAAGSLEAVAARVQALTHLNAASQIG